MQGIFLIGRVVNDLKKFSSQIIMEIEAELWLHRSF